MPPKPKVISTSKQKTTSRDPRKRQKEDEPVNIWHRKVRPLEIGRFEFRMYTEREGRRQQLILDETLLGFDWTDAATDGGYMTGSLTVQKPDYNRFDVRVGDAVVCEYSVWGMRAWRTLWKMYLVQPQYQLSGDQYNYQLEDGVQRLKKSKSTYKFRKDKAHPNGWRVDEAIRHVCEDHDIDIGVLPKMQHRIKKFNVVDATPFTAIARLLRKERTETGIRYFTRWAGGTLNIVPFQRGEFLLRMGGYVLDGSLIETQKQSFATVLDVVATKTKDKDEDEKGHKKREKTKLKATVRAGKKVIERYGVVRKTVRHNDGETIADLKKWGKRELAQRGEIKRDMSFTHPGIPNLRTGDAMMVTIPKAGMEKVICYVGSVSHSVNPGSYEMDITVQFDDPFVDKKADKVRKKKAEAAKKRGRKGDDDKDAEKAKPKAKGKKANQRS